MTAKAICDICGETDDWSQGGKPFFTNGARGEILEDSGSEDTVMKFDLCPTCVEKHLLPLLKEVPEEVLNNYPDFVVVESA